jgi:predicted histone-like DNA-binding protein
MSVKFKSVQRINPQDVTAQKKFYARTIANGATDLDELSKLVASQCTVNRADCYAVLLALEANVIRELENGRIVRLGELGSYQLGVSAQGMLTDEEVNATTIKKARINFRPGAGLKAMLKTLVYKKAQNQSA